MNLKSKTGIAPAVSVRKDAARTYLSRYDQDTHLFDIQMLKTIQMLYLVEYAHFDSQRKIGYGGVVTDDTLENTGRTDNMQYHTGTCAASIGTWGAIRYRYIEDLWSNAGNSLDGCYASGGIVYIISNPASYTNDSGGVSTGIVCATEDDAKILNALFGPIPETEINFKNKSFSSSSIKPYKSITSSLTY